MTFEMVDVSAETFGKYQFCTKVDGLWYADSDFTHGGGCGKLKRGALPSPYQDTEDLTAKARSMHEAAADKLLHDKLNPPQWWQFWK